MPTIIQRIQSLVNQGHTPAQAVEAVAPGADLAYWQKRLAQPVASPKRTTRTRPDNGRRKTRTLRTIVRFPSMTLSSAETQAQRTGQAMAALVERVNGSDKTDDTLDCNLRAGRLVVGWGC